MELDEILKDMRTRCRMAMNGIASASMREKGIEYKLNFGLVIQQIKDIAGRHTPDIELAERLWKEDTRELRILATMMYPIDQCTPETANRWATEIKNQEIREQVCLNFFQELPIATQLAITWANDESEDMRTTGYWLLVRLFLAKKIQSLIVSDYFNKLVEDAASENIFLRNAATLTLKHLGRQSQEESQMILEKLAEYKNNTDPLKAEVYNSVAFEFQYFFG